MKSINIKVGDRVKAKYRIGDFAHSGDILIIDKIFKNAIRLKNPKKKIDNLLILHWENDTSTEIIEKVISNG